MPGEVKVGGLGGGDQGTVSDQLGSLVVNLSTKLKLERRRAQALLNESGARGEALRRYKEEHDAACMEHERLKEEMREMSEELHGTIMGQKAEIVELESGKAAREAEVATLSDLLTDAAGHLKALREKLEATMADAKTKGEEIEVLATSRDALLEECTTQQDRGDRLAAEKEALAREVEQLTRRVDALADSLEEEQDERRACEARAASAAAQAITMEATLERTTVSADESRRQQSRVEQEADRLRYESIYFVVHTAVFSVVGSEICTLAFERPHTKT